MRIHSYPVPDAQAWANSARRQANIAFECAVEAQKWAGVSLGASIVAIVLAVLSMVLAL